MPTLGTKQQLNRLHDEIKECFTDFNEKVDIFKTNILIENRECDLRGQAARLEALNIASLIQDKVFDLLGGDLG